MSITLRMLVAIVCASGLASPCKSYQCVFTEHRRANSHMSRLFIKPSLGCNKLHKRYNVQQCE